jgi:hypothetical protein
MDVLGLFYPLFQLLDCVFQDHLSVFIHNWLTLLRRGCESHAGMVEIGRVVGKLRNIACLLLHFLQVSDGFLNRLIQLCFFRFETFLSLGILHL